MLVGLQPRPHLRHRQRADLFETLGELAGQREPPLAARDPHQVLQHRRQTVRRFEQHDGHRPGQPLRQPFAPRSRLAGRETGKRKTRRLVGGRAARHEGGDHRARPRQRNHSIAGRLHAPHHASPRIADGGSARVGHQRNPLPFGQALHDDFSRLLLVVAMRRQKRRLDPPGVEQRPRGAGVLGSNRIAPAQGVPGAQTQVGQIADRRGYHVEAPLRPGLQGGLLAMTFPRQPGIPPII
ncbi:hypothetical protein CDEF62S_05470 [Castellaniella defragrans]